MAGKSVAGKAKTAGMKALPGGGMGYETAARKYVNAGINNLKLTVDQKIALREKLIPIVSRQMGVERGRTATRAAGIAKREANKKMTSAQKKIVG